MATGGKSMTDALAAGELDPKTAAALIADLKNFESLRGGKRAHETQGSVRAARNAGPAKKKQKAARYEDEEEEDEAEYPSDDERKEEEEEDDRVGKHTLDSDEEEEEKYKRLDIRKVDGQEEGNVDYEGNVKVTAFNMKEDLEDGHFDADGNFIFEKKEDLKDAWLDGLDWADVKRRAGTLWKEKDEENEEDDDALRTQALHDGSRAEIYKGLLEILKPGESLTKALARLGKAKGLTAAEERAARWAAKKAGKAYDPSANAKEAESLTKFADQLISAGEMEAYQLTYEKLSYELDQLEHKAVDDVDMFSDEPGTVSSATASTSAASGSAAAVEDTVEWEYRLTPDGEIFGPFKSEKMQELKETNKLPAGALARRKGTSAFYSVARTDFELYI